LTGMDIFRVFDSLNYVDNLKFGMDSVRRVDGVVEATICYTGDVLDPNEKKYTLDYYMAMADALVEHGAHILAIKDMAGLLKPRAATLLVSTLRAQHPNVPIHVHTHDTAGTGVASQLAAAAAGADILDCAIDSMSGLTSQPSMGAFINAVADTNLDSGIDPAAILPLVDYWEKTRNLYGQFEASSSLKSASSDVYLHEMPGGQYTNLKFQSESLGLGDQWDKVKAAYAMANRALGDIVKVTPSSKVVGDLAQFMVQNDLDEFTVVEKADELSFPGSVVEFMQGLIGQPPHGFPEPFRTRVLKGNPIVEGRPGASLPSVDLELERRKLEEKYGKNAITNRDVMSHLMYPKVFAELREHHNLYGKETSLFPTEAFWNALDEDEEVVVEIAKGNTAHIKYKAVGELQPNGRREVFFETNGVPRVVEVVDSKSASKATAKSIREKANTSVPGSVGAPMAGEVVNVTVEPGTKVKAGEPMVVLSAMKMETAVSAPVSGLVRHVAVEKGDALDAGDLLVSIEV
jgi:pyruvate carboxylase